MRAVIFGVNGKLGRELFNTLSTAHDHVYGLTRAECPVDRPEYVRLAIRGLRPKLVINCTAANNLEFCKEHADIAWAVNVEAPTLMAKECDLIGATFIHFSTDYVFGQRVSLLEQHRQESRLLNEEMSPDPISIYGSTKYFGEKGVTGKGTSFVFRLSTLYGYEFSGPLGPVAQAAMQIKTNKNHVNIPIIYQRCAPTSVRVVAQAITHVVTNHTPYRLNELAGLYHLATSEPVWRKEFVACALGRVFERNDWIFDNLKLPIPRPVHSFLDSRKFQRLFDYELPSWRDDLALTLPLIPAMK